MTKGSKGLTVFSVAALLAVWAVPGLAITENFSSITPGTVVSGEAPGGGTIAGNTYFTDFTIDVTNNGTGPHSLVIFDSSNPTGGDWDLGSPNNGCGGPGVGPGGAPGEPGENCTALGHVLVINDNIVDVSPADGLVDQPDDEAAGGQMRIEFANPVRILNLAFLDLDDQENVNITFFNGNDLWGTHFVPGLGDNSYRDEDLSKFGVITRIILDFSSSGSLVYMGYDHAQTSTESTTWGDVKSQFR